MEGIRQWAFGICAAAIACGMAQLLLPKSSMQRVFNITSSVFFLGCLLSPMMFSVALPDIPARDEIQREVERRSDSLSSVMEERTGEQASESLRQLARQTLERMGITPQKIYINVHDDGENGISISECEVELSESEFPRHDEIRAALMQSLGVNVLIGYKKE